MTVSSFTSNIAKTEVPLCPVCESDQRRELFWVREHEYDTTTDDKFVLKECQSCSATFLDPRPHHSTLGIIYPPNYYTYTLDAKPSSQGSRRGLFARLANLLLTRRLKPITKHVHLGPETRWIDIGCSTGLTLELFRHQFGCSGVGVDISEDAARASRDRGFEAYACRFEDFEAGEESSFDLVYSSHVIEHVESPLAFARKGAQMLKPGGFFIFITPNNHTWEAKFFKRHWGGLHVPRHWAMLNPKTLPILAQKSGLEHIDTAFSTNGVFWQWSMHSILQEKIGRTFADALFPSDHRMTGSGPINIARLALLTGFDIANNILFKSSANMLAVFRKPNS